MKNRFVAVALAVLVAGSLTACSSGSKTPETQAKETQAPETQAPETQAPETQAPETQAPETQAAETQASETQAPETQAAETQAPETQAPETQAAETQAPETQAPVAAAAETEAAVAETEAAVAETEAAAAETEAPAAETEAAVAETEAAAAETEAPAAETEAAVAETEAAAAETEAAAAETEAPAAETEAPAAETEAESADKAVYTIYNETGEAVTSISFYDNSAKKMVVKISEPLADGDSVEVAIDQDDAATPDTTYAFSFQTEGGYVAVYKGLHYGTTPMTLIPADEKTGPVPFLYSAPDAAAETEAESADKAVYTIYNETGEAVTSISFYDNSAKKMVVKISEPLADGDSVEVAIDQDDAATPDTTYAFSFQTEGGYVAVYKGLHYGTTPMTLIPADEKTGPVPFLYSAPDAAAETEAETEADTEASTEA